MARFYLLPVAVFNSLNVRTLQVKLKSITAKRECLQVRRIKKDNLPKDIGSNQQSQNPLLITEQPTPANQDQRAHFVVL